MPLFLTAECRCSELPYTNIEENSEIAVYLPASGSSTCSQLERAHNIECACEQLSVAPDTVSENRFHHFSISLQKYKLRQVVESYLSSGFRRNSRLKLWVRMGAWMQQISSRTNRYEWLNEFCCFPKWSLF